MASGELFSDADLSRLRNARQAMTGQRVRLRCKRCRKKIPDERRPISLYCSRLCQRDHRRELITALRTEMRGEYRQLSAPKFCACGEPLNNSPGRPGPLARHCSKRCRDRQAQRRRRRRIRQ